MKSLLAHSLRPGRCQLFVGIHASGVPLPSHWCEAKATRSHVLTVVLWQHFATAKAGRKNLAVFHQSHVVIVISHS